MTHILQNIKCLSYANVIHKPREAYARYRYRTPLFVLCETLAAFRLHNGLSLSASLSFYAMFALIPLAVLLFFLLSHLVVSSNYAIVKLAIITGNLAPKLSQTIMVEVYNVSTHQVVWGAFGTFALLWLITPLASALRSAFYTILTMVETPSFIHRKIKDVVAVLGILLMFLVFTFLGLILQKILDFLASMNVASMNVVPVNIYSEWLHVSSSLVIGTLIVALFYRTFFPARVALQHILIGSFVTASLWMAMQPMFGLFLSLKQSYGAIFGGMKNMFISIGWLYYSFAVFLLGTELISTLRKKDVLLLRGLFDGIAFDDTAFNGKTFNGNPMDDKQYLLQLMSEYGRHFSRGDYVFRKGEASTSLYYLVAGSIQLKLDGQILQRVQSGDYFGEMALLAQTSRTFDALVESDKVESDKAVSGNIESDAVESEGADVIIISAEHLQTLLIDEPRIAMSFLKRLALQLQKKHMMTISQSMDNQQQA